MLEKIYPYHLFIYILNISGFKMLNTFCRGAEANVSKSFLTLIFKAQEVKLLEKLFHIQMGSFFIKLISDINEIVSFFFNTKPH